MAQNGNVATILVKNIPIFVEKPDFIVEYKEMPKLHFLT
jgi:hypothetical protein